MKLAVKRNSTLSPGGTSSAAGSPLHLHLQVQGPGRRHESPADPAFTVTYTPKYETPPSDSLDVSVPATEDINSQTFTSPCPVLGTALAPGDTKGKQGLRPQRVGETVIIFTKLSPPHKAISELLKSI